MRQSVYNGERKVRTLPVTGEWIVCDGTTHWKRSHRIVDYKLPMVEWEPCECVLYPTYSIAPFSGPQYSENAARAKRDDVPCAICGKLVGAPWPHTAAVNAATGQWARTPEEATQGCFPVGRACHRQYVVLEGNAS